MMVFLDKVVDLTRQRIQRDKSTSPAPFLEEACARREPCPSLSKAISRKPGQGIRVIAEVKRSSPSKGSIRPDLVLEDLIKDYEEGGASAVSVLTEPAFFGGSLTDLSKVSEITRLPILRKDFIIDAYQLLQSRATGSSAVLLITAILERARLEILIEEARVLGLETLVEVHDERELATALETGSRVIGINNRDLKTLQVDLEITRRLAPLVPASTLVVSESGYSQREQVEKAMACGVHAILVGEMLVRAENPRRSLAELRGDDHAPA